MATHIRVLGILHIVFGGLGMLLGAAMFAMFGIAGLAGLSANASSDAPMALPIVGGIGVLIFVVAVVLSAPGVIAGFGLLNFKPWARILTIVISALHLLNFPLGTALGGYGLWALLSREGEALFRQWPAAHVRPHQW
jgi:hypothetical protein